MTTKFDFMTTDEFRNVLEADRQEMQTCFTSKAWKAVHVLAGSIVEAILADFVIAENYTTANRAKKANLAEIINILRDHNAISQTVIDLCAVIKNYRNLVHPGRSIRTQDSVDEHSASVAVSLVEMILKEVGEKKQATYGYTAERLLSKIKSDPSVKSILIHLLKDVNNREQERLLLDLLPKEYMRALEDPEYDPRSSHISHIIPVVFRTILKGCEKEIQEKVANRFVRVLKESSGSYVSSYEVAFFKLSDTQYLGKEDTQLVKDHFAAQLRSRVPEPDVFDCLSGIGSQISEFGQFVSPLIRFACQSSNQSVRRAARNRLSSEYYSSGKEFQDNLMKGIDKWILYYQRIGNAQRAQKLSSLKADIEIPF